MVAIEPPPAYEAGLTEQREVKDDFFRRAPDSPLKPEDVESFVGLDYWEADRALYYVGPIRVHPQRESFEMITTAGSARPCERFGWIEFPMGGLPRKLSVYRLLDMGRGMTADSLLLPFADGTSGEETYPAGRYIDLEGPEGELIIVAGPDGPQVTGPFVLDFNRAYNPSCAYGAPERFACPSTPPENRLQIRIEAGERGFKLPEGEEADAAR